MNRTGIRENGFSQRPNGGRYLILAIFIAALVIRLYSVLQLEPVIQWHDGLEYHRLANCIATQGSYLDPEGRSTASWPPAYPVFLLLLGRNMTAARVLQAVIGAVTVILAYVIARRLIGMRKAPLAAAFTAFYPLYIYVTGVFYPVVLLTFLLGAVFLLLLCAVEENSGRKAFFAGLLGGILALTAAPNLLVLGLVFLWILLESRRGRDRKAVRSDFSPGGGHDTLTGKSPQGIRLAVLFLIPLVLLVGAWSIRNYRVFGEPVLVSTNGGFNFFIGNYPGTKATTGNRQVPGRDKEENALRETNTNEAELDRAFYRKGFEYIKAAPGRFVILSLSKALYFWRFYPEPLSVDLKRWQKLASILSYGVLLPFGLYWLIRNVRGSPAARLILLMFIAYTLLHAVFIAKVRFRLPLDVLLLIAAAGGIGDCAKRLGLRILEP